MNQPIKVIVEVVFDNYPDEKEIKRTIKDYVDSKDFKPEMEYVHEDRKSTRLNSSHTVISYAVFCLKKKKDPT